METTNGTPGPGRRQEVADNLDPGLAQRVAALFGDDESLSAGTLPPLWHWAFFQAPCGESELGEDGHPDDDGFLPPRRGRQRMWAGGEVIFHQPLRLGQPAKRVSVLDKIEQKRGGSGDLTFLLVRHDYYQNGPEPLISERQDIVYRSPAPPKIRPGELPPEAGWQRQIVPTSTLLFRYSAVTFNGHRIHYDLPYATEREGYPGLVVHGPMITTWMLHAFIEAHPRARPRELRYRGQMPLIAPSPFDVGGRLKAPGHAELWAANDLGIAQRASLRFDD